MTGLLALESAARHLSFTQAALELNLTQAAISHRIRTLEETLGTRLFERRRNAIELTEAGRAYLAAIRPTMKALSAATGEITDGRSRERLRLTCLSAFANKCLIPALPEFREARPDVSLRLWTINDPHEIEKIEADVSIRYGDGNWLGTVATKIGHEEIFPVCSPILLGQAGGLEKPDDLRHQTVIRTKTNALNDHWPLWLEKAGVRDMEFADEITCDMHFASVQAAVDGLGVVLGRTAVIEGDLAAGRLVEPFRIRLLSPHAYYVVRPERSEKEARILAFEAWVLGRLGGRAPEVPHPKPRRAVTAGRRRPIEA